MSKLFAGEKKDLNALIDGIKDDIHNADKLVANFIAKHPKVKQKIANAKIDGELETLHKIALEKMPELKPLTTSTPPARPENLRKWKTKTPPARPKKMKDIVEKIDMRKSGMFYGGLLKKKGKV